MKKGELVFLETEVSVLKGNLVGVHIVDFTSKKDKRLKLVSTFWNQNKKA